MNLDTMKVDYEEIYDWYDYTSEALSELFEEYIIALEAEEAENTSETETKNIIYKDGNVDKNEKISKIKAVVDKLLAFIDTIVIKIKNIIEKIMVTDAGFKSEMEAAKKKYKSVDSIEIMIFKYDPNELININNKMKQFIQEIVADFDVRKIVVDTSDTILNMGNSEATRYMLHEKLGLKDLQTTHDLFKHIKDKFRGEKTVLQLSFGQYQYFYNGATKVSEISDTNKIELLPLKARMRQISRDLNVLMGRADVSKELKNTAMKQYQTLISMLNAYISYTMIYYELMVERSLAFRVVCKKFYKI